MIVWYDVSCHFSTDEPWFNFSTTRDTEVEAIQEALRCKKYGGKDISVIKCTKTDITHKVENQ